MSESHLTHVKPGKKNNRIMLSNELNALKRPLIDIRTIRLSNPPF